MGKCVVQIISMVATPSRGLSMSAGGVGVGFLDEGK